MSTLRPGNSIHFRLTKVCSWESVWSIWNRNCLQMRDLKPHFSYRNQAFDITCFGILFLAVSYLWNINCARTTAFIVDSRTEVREKVSKYLRLIMSRPREDLNPQSSDSCWLLYHLSYRGQTFAFPCFEILTLMVSILLFAKLTFEFSNATCNYLSASKLTT